MIEYIDHKWADWKAAGYTNPGWYFWDETEANCYGPYESKAVAAEKFMEYVTMLERKASKSWILKLVGWSRNDLTFYIHLSLYST